MNGSAVPGQTGKRAACFERLRAAFFHAGGEEESGKREQRRRGRRAARRRGAGERLARSRRAFGGREEERERAVAGGGEQAVQQAGEQVGGAAHRKAAAEEGEDLHVDADAAEAEPECDERRRGVPVGAVRRAGRDLEKKGDGGTRIGYGEAAAREQARERLE